ncbi:MAG: tRNA (adenosine(37)-N6)-threonylcarbamoyltransferase complex dimerization subunit type 1 TsaB [Rhodocyclaceae bacterium]|nr:tRNA (adenosine(37)-N6)-threonylcarbamoyltransferase complex dimerization subunit type 1 TsaB [Rhodocyclaceae bacterium]
MSARTPLSKRILALETSTETCSVALLVDGVARQRSVPSSNGHSEFILPLIRELLAEGGLALPALDAIAYGSGPGAFTGLRLACGVAQGLAFGAGLPVLGVGSLEALAWGSGKPRIYAALDARMNEVYFAAYVVNGQEVQEVLAPGVAPAESVARPEGDGWFGCGSGFSAYGEALLRRLGPDLTGFDAAAVPDALAVAQLAAARLEFRPGLDPFEAQPAYVRQKVALTTAERLARGGKS